VPAVDGRPGLASSSPALASSHCRRGSTPAGCTKRPVDVMQRSRRY
jgi:hypothetical protein